MILRRNEKVDGAVKSICELEHRFNHRYGYPWVFNKVGFTEVFKKSVHSVTYISLDQAQGVLVW